MTASANRLALLGKLDQDALAAQPAMETETVLIRNLIVQAQAGKSESFCELCRCYEGRLFTQATALCGDEIVAEDLVQDVLFEAWRSIRRFHGRCQFFTWLCAILLNHLRNERRKKHLLGLVSIHRQQKSPLKL